MQAAASPAADGAAGLQAFDKAKFSGSVQLLGIRVPKEQCQGLVRQFRGELALSLPGRREA